MLMVLLLVLLLPRSLDNTPGRGRYIRLLLRSVCIGFLPLLSLPGLIKQGQHDKASVWLTRTRKCTFQDSPPVCEWCSPWESRHPGLPALLCSTSAERRSSPHPSIERDWHGSVGAHLKKVSPSERWREDRKAGSMTRYLPLYN